MRWVCALGLLACGYLAQQLQTGAISTHNEAGTGAVSIRPAFAELEDEDLANVGVVVRQRVGRDAASIFSATIPRSRPQGAAAIPTLPTVEPEAGTRVGTAAERPCP